MTGLAHPGPRRRNRAGRGSRLLIQAPTSCTGSTSLPWFDPGTRAEQWLVRTPSTAYGAAIAIPFYSRENGNL